MEFSLSKEMWEFSLPKEMWFRIWSNLDFETLQKTCVLVCQGWFENIRDDGRLSGQLSLKNEKMEEEEAKAILSQWKKLRILHLSKNLDQVDMSKTHEFLKKVIVSNVPEGYSNAFLDVLKDYPVSVNKICFNPQDRLNSVGLDNITELTLHLGELEAIEESKKPFVPMGVMKNLIRLAIIFGEGYNDFNFESTIEPLFQGIGFSSNLEEVCLEAISICSDLKLREAISICGDLILRHLSQITRLEIVAIRKTCVAVLCLEDLLWIPNLKNLETLVLSDIFINEGNVPMATMANVKRLELCECYSDENSTFLIKLSEIFPALHTLKITNETDWSWNISVLESILNSLGSIKNLIMSGMRCKLEIPDGFDKPMVQIAMQEAFEIIAKKFPFDSTEIEIEAVMTVITRVETGYSPAKRHYFTIIKEKGKGPFLKIRES